MSTNHTTDTTPFGLGSIEPHPHRSPSLGDAVTDAVEFRVIRPGSPVRRLRLTGNRYTFGSAEGCSIRLNDHALRPMHAVLIRDAHRILVRAYSVPLEVNGNRTTETVLQVGDVMRMGAYRFELLWGPGTPITPMAAPSAIFTAQHQSPQHQSLQDDDTAWQARLRREAEQWRLRQSELETQTSGFVQRESVLNNRESELWNRSEQLRQREVELMSQESAVIHIREDYASKQQEVSNLLEENRARQLEIEKRDEEYRTLESEYRQYAEQARQQLEHSQQQAETATEAVQRMRDQFAALNQQLEEFSQQQKELELSRNQALDAQADSEAKRQLAEQRVAEISTQLDATRKEVELEQREKHERQQANEQLQQANEQLRHANEQVQRANENLQHQVAELQQRVDEASSEAEQLRTDYEGAMASVRQLESLIDQTKAKEHQDRQSWLAETEELRRTVEQISVDLARANAELSEIREANQALTVQLAESEQQRIAAQSEILSRPSSEAIDSLSQELESANARVAEMQREHEDALARLAEQRKADQRQAEQLLIDQREADRLEAERRLAEALAQRAAEIDESGVDQPAAGSSDTAVEQVDPAGSSLTKVAPTAIADSAGVISHFVSTDEPASETAEVDSDHGAGNDQEGWPTYQSEARAGQDLLREMDAENVEPCPTDELLPEASSPAGELVEQPSSWDAAPERSTSTSEEETEDEVGAEHSASSLTGDQSHVDGSAWRRVESQQAATSHSHLESWDADGELDVQAEIDAQDGVVHWQDESPEVSVNEMIDDIEQSVEQVIIDSDTLPGAADDVEQSSERAPEQTFEDSESTPAGWSNATEINEDSIDRQSVASGWNEQLDAWESTESNSETDGSADSLTTEESEHSDSSVSSDEQAKEESLYQGTINQYGAYSEPSADQDSSSDAAGEQEPCDPWLDPSHETDQPVGEVDQHEPYEHQVETPAENSLAEMLIRDLDASEPSADDEPAAEHDNTYVMSEFSAAPLSDDYEPTQAWDRSNFEDAATEAESSDSPADEALIEELVEELADHTSEEIADQQSESSDDDAAHEAAGNDSIEDYMNRLLQRVQRDDDRSEMAETSTLTASSLAASKLTIEEPVAEPEQVDVNAPLIPRSKAPERSHDLTAMRELANSSARSAVAHSVRIQARDTQLKGIMKLLQVGVALACAMACFFFLNWGLMIKSMAIIAILVIAGILAQEAFVLLSDARRRLQIADEASGDESDFYEPVVGLEDSATESGADPEGPNAESFKEISDESGDDLVHPSIADHQDAEPSGDWDKEKTDH